MTEQNPHAEATKAVREGRPVDAQYVRQGRPGVRIMWLLIISTGAAVVVLAALWLFSQNKLAASEPTDREEAAAAQSFNGDAQTPPAADAPTGPTGEAQPTPAGETPNVNTPTAPSN